MFKCLWPKVGGDGLGPSVGGMQDHGSGTFCDVADTSLSHPILVMGTDTTEGDGLLSLADIIHEGPIRKATVVAMIMPDVYSMLFDDAFKGMFGIDGFLGGHGLVQVHICETTRMVSEHTGTTVVASCWLPPCDRDKARNW